MLQLNVADAALQFQPSLPVLHVNGLQGKATLSSKGLLIRCCCRMLLWPWVMATPGKDKLLLERQLDDKGELAALKLFGR